MASLKSIHQKALRGANSDKAAKQFNFLGLERVARTALDLLVRGGHNPRVSSHMPNYETTFCNRYPQDPTNGCLKPGPHRKHLLLPGSAIMLTVCELELGNGLYDLLVLVRNPNGCFVYRAEMVSSIRELTHFLGENDDSLSGSEASSSLGFLSSEPKSGDRPLPLIQEKPVASIPLTADEESVPAPFPSFRPNMPSN
jgi:hypothetical protein